MIENGPRCELLWHPDPVSRTTSCQFVRYHYTAAPLMLRGTGVAMAASSQV